MSLLTQASLIMTPNAIKESKVYSIIPSNGNGDLTFTRGTLASSTLINDAGLVEIVPYNLLTLSESFDNLTAWPNQIGGTGVNATRTPNTVISPNGTLTGDTIIFNRGVGNTSTDQSIIFQSATISPNTDYTFSIWVKASTIGDVGKQVFIRCGGNGAQVAFTLTINWVRIQVSTNITSVGTCYIGSRGGVTTDNIVSVDLWGGQLNQGLTAKDYFFTTDRLNVPRLNYDTVGGCPSLLLEALRTNLVFPSNDFSNASWIKSASSTVTFNSGILNPQNTLGSYSFRASNLAFGCILRQFNTATIGQKYTVSFFVKKGNYRYVGIRFNTSVTLERYPNYDFDTDTLNKQGVTCDLTRDIYSNGWVRLNLSYTATTVNGNCDIALTAVNGDTAPALSGTEFMYVFGAQYELGAYPTSYIPTTSATITRNEDSTYKFGISSLIGSEFTLFFDGFTKQANTGVTRFLLAKESGGTLYSNLVVLEQSASGVVSAIINDNTGTAIFNQGVTKGYNQRVKLALRVKSGSIAYYVGGTQIAVSSTNVTINANDLYVGRYIDGGIVDTKVNSVLVFNSGLTNSEMAALTT